MYLFAMTLHYAEPPSFSTPEMVLLAVLIVLSLGGFFWRFNRVLRNIVCQRSIAWRYNDGREREKDGRATAGQNWKSVAFVAKCSVTLSL